MVCPNCNYNDSDIITVENIYYKTGKRKGEIRKTVEHVESTKKIYRLKPDLNFKLDNGDWFSEIRVKIYGCPECRVLFYE